MQVFDVLESVKEFQVDQAALRDARFVGMLPASELAGYFQSSLGANRIKFDSFGLVELEAMRQQLEAFSHPIYPRFVGDDAGFVAHVEQAADGLAAIGAVVQSTLVDVHAYKCVGRLRVEVAGELHGIR
jgi:hypothetical protein